MADAFNFHDVNTAALYAASATGLFPKTKSSIFRYVGMRSDNAWAALENTVLNNTLPLTISSNLNDPFEANPVVVNDTTPKEVRSFIERFVKASDDMIGGERLVESLSRAGTANGIDEKILALLQRMIDYRNSRCHIGSFSKRISSELQWSHYADGYKGLAYHFVTQVSEQSGFRNLRAVSYSTQRPIILVSELIDQLSNSNFDEMFTLSWLPFEQRSFLTKSTEWAYEEEHRIVKQNADSMTFSDSELVSIVVGPRFPNDSLNRLRAIVGRRDRPLKLFRASPSPTSYGVEVEWSKEII